MSGKTNNGSQTDDLRSQLLFQRYLLKDPEGNPLETPRTMLIRVAKAVAAAEATYGATPAEIHATAKQFFRMMKRGMFLPNSPTLMNAGRPGGLLSACFVIGIDDSVEGIFEAVKQTALIQKAGGGTGFAFDTLRPTGDYVSSSGGHTSGPISFWRVFAEATNAIQQGAHRRGANMGMMSIDHPDILKFITAKQDQTSFVNFNISVKVPDAFMTALQDEPDRPHVVVNPRTGRRYGLPRSLDIRRYSLQDLVPVDAEPKDVYTVRQIWEMIITSAHTSGEPGVCFMDCVNRNNPTPALGRIEATNPCGEQPLLASEACNLGSINIARFIKPDSRTLNWEGLKCTVTCAVRFLDDVIDANHYPVPQIEEYTKRTRKIGLGIMGLADALVWRNLPYDSDEALTFSRKVCQVIQETAHAASCGLAHRRGCFPAWEGSIWDTQHHQPMRNACCTTIAPTGSVSIIAGCSSGIEPIFSLAYRRRALDGHEFDQLHPLLERLGMREGWLNDNVRRALFEGVPASQIPGIPATLARVLVTAHQISPEWHVRMQAAVQEHVDNAVSKTVNLPADATVADVDKVFRSAFKLRCKGITVYRDACRSGQTLSKARQADAITPAAKGGMPRARGCVTEGKTYKFRMGCGTLFVTVNQDKTGLAEVFANLGKAGGCPSQSEATCRAVSAALRSGVRPEVLIEQLRGIRCLSTCTARKDNADIQVLSCPDAIAKAIEMATAGKTDPAMPEALTKAVPSSVGRSCPRCQHPMRKDSGCLVCDRCLHSSCA